MLLRVVLEVKLSRELTMIVDLVLGHRLVVEFEAFQYKNEVIRQSFQAHALMC